MWTNVGDSEEDDEDDLDLIRENAGVRAAEMVKSRKEKVEMLVR